jgi:predicted DNA-binding ribbon-helix-helix protein
MAAVKVLGENFSSNIRVFTGRQLAKQKIETGLFPAAAWAG